MKDFKQIHCDGLPFFKEDMKKRWGLVDYCNPNEPAIFLGLYTNKDKQTFINHKSEKLLYFGGADCDIHTLNLVKGSKNTVCIAWSPWLYPLLDEWSIPYKKFHLPLKDYSMFKPTVLGDKIYVYKGLNGNRHGHYKWNEIIKPLEKEFGSSKIIYTNNVPFNKLIKEYYNNCFVYVKPNSRAGSTTMWELGYMGRKTISTDQGDLPHVLESHNKIDTIIELIGEESKKIGYLQTELSNNVHNSFMNDDVWLNMSYYKNFQKQ